MGMAGHEEGPVVALEYLYLDTEFQDVTGGNPAHVPERAARRKFAASPVP